MCSRKALRHGVLQVLKVSLALLNPLNIQEIPGDDDGSLPRLSPPHSGCGKRLAHKTM